MLVDEIESWLPVVGLEGIYSISSLGNVRRDAPTRGFGSRSVVGLILKQKLGVNGYKSVCLSISLAGPCKQRHFLVHGLVAAAFLGSRPEGLVVNHRDGNKTNNELGNLEYVSPSENIRHAYRTGLAMGKPGESNAMAVLNSDTALAIRTLRHEHGWSTSALCRAFRLDCSRVHRIISEEIWRVDSSAPTIPAW